jgi:hypothetical protein
MEGVLMNKFIVCLLVLFMHSFPFCAYGEDWRDCADELDRLRRAARHASEAAEEAASAKEEVENKKDELQNCLNWPDTFDLMDDNCQNLRWDYDSALSDYRYKLSNLESELSTVESRIRSVQWSCGYEFSLGAYAAPSGAKS